MINILIKYYKKKNFIFYFIIFFVLVIFFVNSFLEYQLLRKNLYKDIDSQLKSAVLNAKLLLGDDFFKKAILQNRIEKEDEKIIKLSKLAKNSNVEYVYFMIKKKNRAFFLISSATEKELKENSYTRYMDSYEEATPVLIKSFDRENEVYEESKDRWGSFRSVLIPFKIGDKSYIGGADIRVDYIKGELNKFILISFLFPTFFIVVSIIFIIYFSRLSKKEFNEIKNIEKKLKDKIEEKTKELKNMNINLEKRVKKEVELSKNKDKYLLEYSKFIQMGELMSMIAHHWRQPLAAIGSANNAIMVKSKLDKLDKKSVDALTEKINEYVLNLSQTIDEFKNFFQKKGVKSRVGYDKLIGEVLKVLDVSIKETNIEVKLKLKSKYKFFVDENDVKLAILNILKNSVENFGKKDIKNAQIYIATSKNFLFIEDNGGGIDKKIIDKVFDPYFSTKNIDGTGLGLYMSKLIIENRCGGYICVKNGKMGARFIIYFPRASNEE